MQRILAGVILACLACSVAWAHDADSEGRPHSHWWLDLDGWKLFPYGGFAIAGNGFSAWPVPLNDDGSFVSYREDDAAVGTRFFAGVDFLEYFGLEAGYADFGEASFVARSDGSGTFWNAGDITQRLDLTGFDLSLLGRMPFARRWAVFGRAGLLRAHARYAVSGDLQASGPFTIRDSTDGTHGIFGGGIEYQLAAQWRLVASYATAEFRARSGSVGGADEEGEVESLGVSIAYAFRPPAAAGSE